MHGNPEDSPAATIEAERDEIAGRLSQLAGEIREQASARNMDSHGTEAVSGDAIERAEMAVAQAADAVSDLTDGVETNESIEAWNRQQGLRGLLALRDAEQFLGESMHTEADASVDGDDQDTDTSGGSGGGGKLKKAIDAIIGKLQSALSKLWHLLLRLISPKEWKISGEISGGIPALGMATAKVEITFG